MLTRTMMRLKILLTFFPSLRLASGLLLPKPVPQQRHVALFATRVEDTEAQQRLLLTEPAVSAYVGAEVHAWLLEDKMTSVHADEVAAVEISEATRQAYSEAAKEGVLSHHGVLIAFINTELQKRNLDFEQLNTNPYSVSKRCVDLLHHLLYRGAYTTTLDPIGVGDDAARAAVGLPMQQEDEEDNCIVEPPPEIVSTDCLWSESDDAAWRKERFERITMEGYRDPRRGNSGTSR